MLSNSALLIQFVCNLLIVNLLIENRDLFKKTVSHHTTTISACSGQYSSKIYHN